MGTPSPTDRNPTDAKRRELALLFAVTSGLASLHAWLVRGRVETALAIALCGLVLACAALTRGPGRHLYVAWMALGAALGRITSPVVLAIVYFALVTPIALLSRLVGRDRLRLRRRPPQETYWEPAPEEAERERYFRPF